MEKILEKFKNENKILFMLAFLVYLKDYGKILDNYGFKTTI